MKHITKHKNFGMVLALTMIFLVIAVSIAGVMISSGSTGLQQSVNQQEAHQARLAAESGAGYLSALIQRIPLSETNDPITDVGVGLSYGIVNASVYLQGDVLQVYPVAIENGGGGMFSAQISKTAEGNYLLTVTGTSGSTARTVSMEFSPQSAENFAIFDNGFLLGGKLQLTDGATFNGKNDPSEAQVFTNYLDSDEAFDLSGNAKLEGDLYAANPKGYASISNGVTVAGETDYSDDGAIWDHITFGAPLIELPRPDPTVFEPLATSTIPKKTAGNVTFTNIRIPANTNPKFTGTVNLEGVIYIESPNKLQFLGDVIVTGVIVTEDPGPGQIVNNYIDFGGDVKFQDISTLPDTPEHAALRSMPGATLLAPGFGVEFTGNFGTVGGALAAEKFILSGSSGGTVRGPVINYSSDPFEMSGSTYLTIDRSGSERVPPGFNGEITVLTPILSTYKELRK
jgi:hypothetical protein